MIESDSQHFMIHSEFIDLELISSKCKKSQVADVFLLVSAFHANHKIVLRYTSPA